MEKLTVESDLPGGATSVCLKRMHETSWLGEATIVWSYLDC